MHRECGENIMKIFFIVLIVTFIFVLSKIIFKRSTGKNYYKSFCRRNIVIFTLISFEYYRKPTMDI